MKPEIAPTIWTIGHSTRPWEVFEALLLEQDIQLLADVRSIPHSRWNPQYNQARLATALKQAGMGYQHLPALGGRQKVQPSNAEAADSGPFGTYAAYMQTDTFKNGMKCLKSIASQQRTAYMCAEGPWRNCHRSLISEQMKQLGWQVLHIVGEGVVEPHPDGFGGGRQQRLL